MKRTLHKHTKIFIHFLQKSIFILLPVFLGGSFAIAQTDIPISGKLLKKLKINERGALGTLVVDPNAVYSNVTTFSGQASTNGFSKKLDNNTITNMIADSLGTIGSLPLSIGSFKLTVANLNAEDVSARVIVRFYANNGAGGGPGTFMAGYSFNPATFTNGTVTYFISGDLPAPFAITTQGFWAGVTFDDNKGTTGITKDQLNNLGQGLFAPIDIGTSTDDFFSTDTAGSFTFNNPEGGYYDFRAAVPALRADFGWEFVSSIPLPVTLTDFKVQRSGLTNTVSWKTSQEVNSNYFSVQRSNDGSNFTEIGRVKAAGKSATVKNYSFADVSPKKGNNFYRIKMVDLDNSRKFSDIKNVRNDALLVFSLYPNPVQGNMVVEWNAETSGSVAITISDMNGRVIYNKESDVISGNNKVTIDASKFAKGVYNIKVTSEDDSYTRTFNKL